MKPAPTAVPAIAVPDMIDTVYSGAGARDLGAYLRDVVFDATNSPTRFSFSGYPANGVTVDPNGALTYDLIQLSPPGRYTVTVTATNAIGSSSRTVEWQHHPRVLSIETDKTSYAFGDTILLTATFDGAVVVTGSPPFGNGLPYVSVFGGTRRASYLSGSGSTKLVFRVQHTAADGPITEYPVQGIELNGSTIAHASGVSAVLTAVAQVGLSPKQYSVVSGPAVHPVALIKPAAGTYRANNAIAIGVKFNERISYTGAPRVALQVGSATRYATASMVFGGDTMIFAYPVATGDVDGDGITISNTIELNGGTLTAQSATVNPSLVQTEVTASMMDLSAVRVDTAAAAIAAPVVSPTVITGVPGGGGWWSYQCIAPGSSTTYSAQGLPAGFALDAATGYLHQLDNNGAVGTFPFTLSATNAGGTATAQMTLKLVSHLPEYSMWLPAGSDVITVGIPASGIYHPGDVLTFTVFAAGHIAVGTPRLPLMIGSRTRYATYVPADSQKTLVFRYTVAADDVDDDGIGIAAGLETDGGFVDERGSRMDSFWSFPVDSSGIKIAAATVTTTPASSVTIPATQGATGTQGAAFSYHIIATGATGYAVASGTLPAGLSLDGTSGNINGTPSAAGTTTVGIRASDSSGSATGNLTFTINAPTTSSGGSTTPVTPPVISVPVVVAPPVVNVPPAVTTPPVTTTVPPTTIPPTTTPPVTPVKVSQTIVFNSPVSAIMVGQPIALGARSSADLPITYSVVSGDATLAGSVLTPRSTAELIVRAASPGTDTVAASSVDVNFGHPQKAGQTIALGTLANVTSTAGPIALASATSAGLPITYTVTGPAKIEGGALVLTGAAGTVTVRATSAGNDLYAATEVSQSFVVAAAPAARMINLSSRLRVVANDASRAMIAGFVVTGNEPKTMLVRAIGPSLAAFGVQGALANPRLQVYNSSSVMVSENEDWSNNPEIAAAADRVGAFRLEGTSKDAAVLVTLPPGAYTAQVEANGGSGVALIEVYDANAATGSAQQLVNLSTRGFVDVGDANLIAGFVVSGNAPKQVLIRGIGPSLTGFGVPGAVANPTLKVYAAGSTTVIAQNDDWGTAQPVNATQSAATAAEIVAASTSVGAFPLSTDSRDPAIIVTLMPGAYTAVVSGADNTTGAGLVEVYQLSNQ